MIKRKLLSKIGRKKTTQLQRFITKGWYLQAMFVHEESGWTCSQIIYTKKLKNVTSKIL